jgi:hypothetical protein
MRAVANKVLRAEFGELEKGEFSLAGALLSVKIVMG